MKDKSQIQLQLSRFLPILLIFIFALTIRVYLVFRYGCINPDGVRYIEAAALLSKEDWGNALASFYPPGYPIFIALVHTCVRDWELAGQAVSLVLGCLTLFPLFFLMRDVYSRRIALLAILLLSFSPYHARLSAEVRSEAAYIFFTSFALLCLHLAAKKHSISWAGFCGLAGSAAYLLRPEGGGIVAVAGIFLLAHHLRHKEFNFRKAFVLGSVLVLCFLPLSVPYILYLRNDTGQWMVSRKTSNVLALGMHEYDRDLAEVSPDESSSTSALSIIVNHPQTFLKKFIADLFKFVPIFSEAIHFTVFPFFAIGLIKRFSRRHPPNEDILLWVFFLFYLMLFSLFFANRRFFVQLVPVALGCTGSAVESVAEYLGRLARKKNLYAIALNPVPVILASLLITTLPKTLTPIDKRHHQYKEAGLWLRRNSARDDLVITNRERMAFYAQRDWVRAEGRAPSLQQVSSPSAIYLALTKSDEEKDDLAAIASMGTKVAEFQGGSEAAFIYRLDSSVKVFAPIQKQFSLLRLVNENVGKQRSEIIASPEEALQLH